MQPTGPGTSNRFEAAARRSARSSGPGRDRSGSTSSAASSCSYLVIGGWNTVFGYGGVGAPPVPAGRSPALPRDRGPRLADRGAERVPRVSLSGVPQPRARSCGELPRFSLVYVATLVVEPRRCCPIALDGPAVQHLRRSRRCSRSVVVVGQLPGHQVLQLRGRERRGDATGPSVYDPLPDRRTDGARRPKGAAVPLLTILTPCYNEEGNVREVYAPGQGGDERGAGLRLRPPVHRQRVDRQDGRASCASWRRTTTTSRSS